MPLEVARLKRHAQGQLPRDGLLVEYIPVMRVVVKVFWPAWSFIKTKPSPPEMEIEVLVVTDGLRDKRATHGGPLVAVRHHHTGSTCRACECRVEQQGLE